MTKATELQPSNVDFSVKYNPTEITITNFDELKAQVVAYAKKYENPVTTIDTVKSDMVLRKQMKSLTNQMNDRRKEIKREYNKPLVVFENQVKELTTIVQNVIDPIDSGIKAIEQKEQLEKKKHVIQLVEQLCEENAVPTELIEQNDKWWLNKTAKDKDVVENIVAQIAQIKDENKRQEEQRVIVTNYAKVVNVEAEGWLAMVDDGKSAAEIIRLIEDAREQAKAKKAVEAERARKRLESEKAIAEMRAAKAVEVNNHKVDSETGEIIQPEVKPKPVTTINLTLELRNVSSEQTYLLRDFLTDNNFNFTLNKKK